MGKVIKEEDLRLNIIVNGNDTRQKIGEMTRSIGDLNAKNKQLEAQRKKLRAEGQKDSRQYKELTDQINANKAAIQKYQSQINSLRSSMKVGEMTMAELQQRAKLLSAQLRNAAPGTKQYTQLEAELRKVNNRMAELKAQTRGVAGVMDKIGLGKLQSFLGKCMIYYTAILGIFRLFSGGIAKIKEFEQANVDLSTILGVHISQMTALTKSALELGRTTEYTASQVTGLQTELAKLGYGQQAILQMEEPILRFATAVGAELPEAAALAGATLRAFDKDATDAEDVLGTMAVATNKSALSFSYLQTSMSIVAPVAKTFGFGLKDTVALLGTLANNGFDASSAATATRNILLNLADANGKLAKELGKPVKTLPDLIDGLHRLDEKGVNLAKTLELTDKRSVAAFNSFLWGADSMGELRDNLENVDGELKRIGEERLQTVEGSIKLMQSAWEGLVLAFYNSKGTIKSIIDFIASGITGITNLLNPDAVVDSLKTGFISQLMETYGQEGEDGLKRQIDTGLQYWERQYHAAKKRYMDSGGLFGKGEFERTGNLYKAFVGAGNDALDRAAQLKAEETERKEREADEKRRVEAQKRQEAAAAAYKALDEKEIAERVALKKKYLDGTIATEEEYNTRLLQLNIDALQKRLRSSQLKGKERLTMEEQLTTLLLQQKKQEQDRLDKIENARIKSIVDATERENAEYEFRRRKAAGNTRLLEQLEAQHNRALAKIQLDKINTSISNEEAAYKRERQNLRNQQAAELLAFTGSAEEKKKLRKQHNEELLRLDMKYASDMAAKLRQLLDNGNFGGMSLDSAILSDEEKDKLQQKLLEVQEKLVSLGLTVENLKGGELNAVGGTKDLLGFTLDDWATLYENLKQGKVGVQEVAMALSAMASAYATYDKFATASENRQLKQFKKANDQKKKDLERRLNAGLIRQDQYNAKVEELDEAYEAKQEELQLKQARRQKSLSIIDAIINTAVGVTAALKLGPIIGPILAAMIGAMGAVQVALITSQPVGGAEEGGVLVTRAQDGKKFKAAVEPNRRGYVAKPTVITGENGLEYIIPNEAMANPTARPIIDLFETVRQQGRLADFDFGEVIPALFSIPGRAAGGRVSGLEPGSSVLDDSSNFNAVDPALLRQLHDAVQKLSDKLDDPIPAYVTLLGRNGLIEQLDKYNRNKKLGKLG